jgi:hypothetical protein
MPVTTLPTSPDSLTSAVERGLGQARVVRSMLYDSVIPHLPNLKRGAAEHIARRINRGSIFDETMLHDLGALIALVEREAEAGTHRGWQADENHIEGGRPLIHRDERAEALASSTIHLRGFHEGIAAVLDTVEAERVRQRLLADE